MKYSALTPIAIVITLALPAYADDDTEYIIVTGSRTATRLSDTPASISTLTRNEIERQKPHFIGEVLNQLAGVYMTDLGNEQHSMSIRQPLSYNALYLYMEDGIPIRPLGLFNHNALYEVNLTGEQAIEVLRGPGSSLYGANSVGGTVNFLSARPGLNNGVRFATTGSDQSYQRLEMSGEGTMADLAARASLYVARNDGGWQDFNSMEKEALTVRADESFGDRDTLKVLLTHNHLRTDMPGSLSPDDFDNRPGYSYHTFTYREVYATRLAVTWDHDSDIGPSTVSLYARDNSTEQLPSYLIFGTTGRLNNNDFQSLGVIAQQVWNVSDNFRVIAGMNSERSPNDYVEDGLLVVRDNDTHVYTDYTVATRRREYDVVLDNNAVFTQAEWQPIDALHVVAGARYDHIQYDYRNHLVPSAMTGAPDEQRDFSHVSPRVGVAYQIADDKTIYATASQGFTPPEVSGLYGRLETPNLKESIYDNIEIGFRYTDVGERWLLDLALYQLQGQDEVVNFNPTGVANNAEPRNAGATTHRGLEFSLQHRINREWLLQLSGAHAEHRYDDYAVGKFTVPSNQPPSPLVTVDLNYDGNDMPQAPNVLANLGVVWTPTFAEGFTVSVQHQHMGDYFMDNANTVRYEGHKTWNLRAQYSFKQWTLWMKLLNAGDEHYAEVASSSYNGVELPSSPELPNGYSSRNALAQDTYTAGAPRSVFIGFSVNLQ